MCSIIENQLEATNHDHLGKVLTYLTNLDAKAAIWVSTAPRPEDIRAIQRLNETTPEDIAFYLVKLAAYRISGHDAAALLFTVIVGPSAEAKSFGKDVPDIMFSTEDALPCDLLWVENLFLPKRLPLVVVFDLLGLTLGMSKQ